MKKYRFTKKGIKYMLAICVALAMFLGFCLSFTFFYHLGRQRIYAMALDEAVRLVDEREEQWRKEALNVQKSGGIQTIPEEESVAHAEDIVLPVVVLFDEDLACLNSMEYLKLHSFVNLAQQRRTERICVAGHAAFSSDEFAGDSLSYLRAKAVKEYLVYCGVQEARIDIEANGYHQPFDEENITSFRNRRVEISFS